MNCYNNGYKSKIALRFMSGCHIIVFFNKYYNKDIIVSNLDFNGISFFQAQPGMTPNAVAHGTGKSLPKLGNNTKLIGYVALGTLALLIVVGGSLAAKTLWFDQTTGPSNSGGGEKSSNNIFNHFNDTCPATYELPFSQSCDDLNEPLQNINLSPASNGLCTLEFYNNVMIAVNLTRQKQPTNINKQNTDTSEEIPIITLNSYNQRFMAWKRDLTSEKQIIDLIFSNIELLEKKHNELLTQAILNLIRDFSNHQNIDYILNKYGIENFLKHFGKILTPEFLEQYHPITKKLTFDCLHCQTAESKEFLTKTFNVIKNKLYFSDKLALACVDSEENHCKEFILEILPQLIEKQAAYDLAEKCAKADTDVCNMVMRKALEPILSNNAANEYDLSKYMCVGSKTKSCIDLLPKVFAVLTERDKKTIEYYCNLEVKPKFAHLDSSAVSLALTTQTACDSLYGSKEFQDFKNPSLMTRIQRILS